MSNHLNQTMKRIIPFLIMFILVVSLQAANASGDYRMVFVSQQDSNKEIYGMNAGGSGANRVTHADSKNSHVTWAPRTASTGAAKATLKRFLLRFPNAYLVHQPGAGNPQIVAQGSVLSYGSDWEVREMKPYLYHLRQRIWKGFYWKVNTSRKEVYRVKGGSFGQLGGQEQALNIQVDPAGNKENPERFLLRFPNAYLVHQPGAGNPQIVAQGNVLSYGSDWEVREMKPYLYHVRQRIWKGFYWKVNTSRKEVYRVKGGSFGQLGGQEQTLNIQVDPVY